MKATLKVAPRLTSEKRLHQCPLPIIGLTGGIAAGKSAVSALLRQRGLEIIDADELVKLAYQRPEVIESVAKLAPSSHREGAINFKILRSLFFQNEEIKKAIETLIYRELPLLFVQQLPLKQDFVIYDVPLLFEKDLAPLVDYSVVVYAPLSLQKERLIARDGIDNALADQMLAAQLSLESKKSKADYVIDNSGPLTELAQEVERFLEKFMG